MTPSLSAATASTAGRCRRSCPQLSTSMPRADGLCVSPISTLRSHLTPHLNAAQLSGQVRASRIGIAGMNSMRLVVSTELLFVLLTI